MPAYAVIPRPALTRFESRVPAIMNSGRYTHLRRPPLSTRVGISAPDRTSIAIFSRIATSLAGGNVGYLIAPSLITGQMHRYTQMANVFAWQNGQQWYYVRDRTLAPQKATEARFFRDDYGATLSIDRVTSGVFVRNAKHWTAPKRQ